MNSMPQPTGLLLVLTRPFVLVVGGYAFLLGVLHLVIGVDPTVPVDRFLTGSVNALLPFCVFLSTLWLYYLVVYLMAGASIYDLCLVAQLPVRFARFLWRHLLPDLESMLRICLVSPFSEVRLYRPYLPSWPAMGWRAGYSAQLE